MKTNSFLKIALLAGIACVTAHLKAAAMDLRVVTPYGATTNTGMAGGDSVRPLVSESGRYVLFASSAENLLPAGQRSEVPRLPSKLQVLVQDRESGSSRLVSLSTSGDRPGDDDSIPMGISANGRYALFQSWASNLVADDTNGSSDVFIRDLEQGVTRAVSVNVSGGVAGGASSEASMTADGRFVAFVSSAPDIVPGDTNGLPDVFVRDMQLENTRAASYGAAAQWPGSGAAAPQFSPDARYVAFVSSTTNVAAGGVTTDVYVYELTNGITRSISQGVRSELSPSARFYGHQFSGTQSLIFEAYPGLAPQTATVFRYDLASSTTSIVATNAAPPPAGHEYYQGAGAGSPDGAIAYVGAVGTNSETGIFIAANGTNHLVGGLTGPRGSAEFLVQETNAAGILFVSTWPGLAANSPPGAHLYQYDGTTAKIQLLDPDASGGSPEKGFLNAPQLAGSEIFFDATDALLPEDSNRAYDVFATDNVGALQRLSSASDPVLTRRNINLDPVFSATSDGRFVVYARSQGIVSGQRLDPFRRIFIRDLAQGTESTVGPGPGGAEIAGSLADPLISADGRILAFTATTGELAPGDTNGLRDVFIRDLVAGTNALISANITGSSGTSESRLAGISTNGKAILFASAARNLGGTLPYENVYWRNLATPSNVVVAAGLFYAPRGFQIPAAMTPDGRYVVQGRGDRGAWLWDSQTQTTVFSNLSSMALAVAVTPGGDRVVAVGTNEVVAFDRATDSKVVLSPSSKPTPPFRPTVEFDASGTLLVYPAASAAATTGGLVAQDIYLYNFATRENKWITRDQPGISYLATISPDGRFVAFLCAAATGQPIPQLYLYDVAADSTIPISGVSVPDPNAMGLTFSPRFTADSRTLLFGSWAPHLVPGDYNERPDIFALGLGAVTPSIKLEAQIIFASPGTGLLLSWAAAPGKSYEVQFKNSLDEPAWRTLGTPTIDNNGRAEITDSSLQPRRFYRVRED